MAKRKKTNKKLGRGGRAALIAFAAVLLCLGAAAGIGIVNASIVRIRRADVVVPDLPDGFEGMRLLYASDIDLCGLNTPERSAALFNRLQSLSPDLLILGGDYTSISLLDTLNRPDNTSGKQAKAMLARESFFHYISGFDAPMGKFAIAAPEDPDWDTLSDVMKQSGIRPLFNDRTAIRSGSDTLWLVGVCEERSSLNAAGSAFEREDCVLVAAYSPVVLPILLTSEASDGGAWADLALCGHTHGGQIRLFGRTVLSLDSREQRFLSGWNVESGLPILVSQGVGCEGLNLRLGSAPEVWLLTLHRQ